MDLVLGCPVLKVSSSFVTSAVAFCLSKCSPLTVGRKKALLAQIFLVKAAETLAPTDTLGCVCMSRVFSQSSVREIARN